MYYKHGSKVKQYTAWCYAEKSTDKIEIMDNGAIQEFIFIANNDKLILKDVKTKNEYEFSRA